MKYLVVACLAAGCISPVIPIGGGKKPRQAQHETLSSMGPARLVMTEKWSGEITTKRIRVFADVPYRSQNRQWQKSFEEPLEMANLVLTRSFGVKLEAEYIAWDRHEPGSRLSDDIAALEEQDPGTDVFAVIGLTSSLPLVSATYEELGLAMINGRHVMLRGYADLAERKMYANAFPDLTNDEREMALLQLRHHKTGVVLLHELGHILGVDHEDDATTIMHGSYSNHVNAFSDHAEAIMRRSIDQRIGRGGAMPDPEPEAQKPQQETAAAPVQGPIVIEVTKDGSLYVGGERLRWDEVLTLLKTAFAADANTHVQINKDRKAPAHVVGDLVDRAKAIGLTKFEFGWTGR
jgi:predicted Zn-dependent protease